MPIIDYKAVVATAKSEIGYQGESKNSKFTRYLDERNWYNYKKAGACTWCAIFYDYCVAVNEGSLSDEQARQIVCEPANHNQNAGAGCVQKADYYKSKGRWISEANKCTTGDQIFFKNSSGIYHTGIVVGWDGKGIYTVEGSTGGAKVLQRYYYFNDSKIAGFGRPDWYKYQDNDPKPEPTPDPEPTPTTTKYKVKTNGGTLALHATQYHSSPTIANIPNGTTLDVTEIVKGEPCNGTTDWAHTSYNNKIGYCTCSWLVKVDDTTVSMPAPSYTIYKVKTNTGIGLNIRKKPNGNSTKIGWIPENKECKVYSISDGWAYIEYNGIKGYSSAKYLKKK